ncbi:hypothetical protein [Dyella sp.]|uniref:hypothetical protein n=1 Tax=Dyella sp. TaxID=1869338 RepID=UPI0039C87579
MIFASHGHDVAQEDVVQRTYGQVVCAPSNDPINIARNLASAWVDRDGASFSSNLVAAFDALHGVQNIDNAILINELANNRPLLYGNSHHAMVIVSVDYLDTPLGPNVQAVGVMDPWPGSPGFHSLSPSEMMPTPYGEMFFLAAVYIT